MKYITGLLQRIVALAFVLKLRAQKQEASRKAQLAPRPSYLPQPIFRPRSERFSDSFENKWSFAPAQNKSPAHVHKNPQ